MREEEEGRVRYARPWTGALRQIITFLLALTKKPGMSPPPVVLVWNQGNSVSRKSRRTNPTTGTPISPSVEQKGKSTTWTAPSITNAILGAIGLLIAGGAIRGIYYLGALDEKVTNSTKVISSIESNLKSFSEKTTETLQKIDNQLVRLEERVKSLELRNKATVAGLKDPNIVPVRFSEPSPLITNKPNEKIPYHLTFTIKEITKETIKFVISGEINTIEIQNMLNTLPFQVGVPVNLLSAIGIKNFESLEPFSVWLVILEVHATNTAIIAIGPKATPPTTNIG